MSPSSLYLPRKISALLLLVIVFAAGGRIGAAEPAVIRDLSYKPKPGAEEEAACRLDLYLPSGEGGYASLLWLHGGGLTGGSRSSAATQRIARRLAAAGIAVASADYRLNPAVTYPTYIEDAAAAWAWLHAHVAEHGGDPSRVFVGGHSAGAYLALMVGLDARYLATQGVEPNALAGVVAISGQTSTHFTIREERKSSGPGLVVDEAAPLFHVRPRKFPILVLYAGSDMPLRLEENRLLAAALRHAGGAEVRDALFADRDHSTIIARMAEPEDAVAAAVIAFLREARRAAE